MCQRRRIKKKWEGIKMINKLTTDHLKLLINTTDKKNPKIEMGHVYFDGENKAIVASDTKRMVVLYNDHGINNVIMNRVVIEALLKETGRKKYTVSVVSVVKNEYSFYGIEVKDTGTKLLATPIQGKFPNWKRIVADRSNAKHTFRLHKLPVELEKLNINCGNALKDLIRYIDDCDVDVYIYDRGEDPSFINIFGDGFTFVFMGHSEWEE